MAEKRNDLLTAAAIGVLAMCVVTFDHEALGHGSACVLLDGRILLLTSSLFRCDVRSGWIDPAGPFVSLLMGTLSLACLRFVPAPLVITRVFLIHVTAFSYFWESGYLIRAMQRRDGDLYSFLEFLLGNVSIRQRWLAASIGLALYVLTIRVISNEYRKLWPRTQEARSIARTIWISATGGAAMAALAYTGHGWDNLTDAILEIGGASFPLLFIPQIGRRPEERRPSALMPHSLNTVVVAVIIYTVFVAFLGRGITPLGIWMAG